MRYRKYIHWWSACYDARSARSSETVCLRDVFLSAYRVLAKPGPSPHKRWIGLRGCGALLLAFGGLAAPAVAQRPAARATEQMMTIEKEGKQVYVMDGPVVLNLRTTPGARAAVIRSAAARVGRAADNVPSQETLQGMASEAAEKHRIDPALVHAIIDAESGWNPFAVSAKGARGLMQLMPEKARELGVKDSFDPAQNLEGGVRHLRELLEQYNGNLDFALAAYNAGGGAVARAGGVPNYRETREYVRKITDAYFSGGTNRQPFVMQVKRAVYSVLDGTGRRIFTNE